MARVRGSLALARNPGTSAIYQKKKRKSRGKKADGLEPWSCTTIPGLGLKTGFAGKRAARPRRLAGGERGLRGLNGGWGRPKRCARGVEDQRTHRSEKVVAMGHKRTLKREKRKRKREADVRACSEEGNF